MDQKTVTDLQLSSADNCLTATDLLADDGSQSLVQPGGLLACDMAQRLSDSLVVQDVCIRALACLAEVRDNATGLHVVRTRAYVQLLAQKLLVHPRFSAALEGDRLDMIVMATPLHDIGKIGVPDAVLLKPGPLNDHEFDIVKRHAGLGSAAIHKAIGQVRAFMGQALTQQAASAFACLQIAADIALCHHEKWDGSGYPSGLSGDAIPVGARLMALADVFDALTSRRIYKPAMPVEQSLQIIQDGRGSHFDPDVVDAFVNSLDDFAQVAVRFSDRA